LAFSAGRRLVGRSPGVRSSQTECDGVGVLMGLTASDPNAQRQTVSFKKQLYVSEGIF
jgi:hypothetical protein